MYGRHIASILIFFIVAFPTVVLAKVFDIEATGEYVMGDNDTKTEARRIALEHAKRNAAEQAGSYVVSTTVVKNGMLTKDEIISFISAILKTTVVSENMSLLENKATCFHVDIAASVDTSHFESKITELQADVERRELLVKLKNDNVKLLQELDLLSKQISASNSPDLKNLRQKREDIFVNIDDNDNSIKITFEKGTLKRLVVAGRKSLDEDKKKIDNVFNIIASNIVVTIGEPKVHSNSDSTTLTVPFNYYINRIAFNRISAAWADLCDKPFNDKMDVIAFADKVANAGWINCCIYKNREYSEELADYGRNKNILITLNAGAPKYVTNLREEYEWEYKFQNQYQAKFFFSEEELSDISTITSKVSVVDDYRLFK